MVVYSNYYHHMINNISLILKSEEMTLPFSLSKQYNVGSTLAQLKYLL